MLPNIGPTTLAQDAPAPQSRQKLPPGKDLDALDETGGAFVANEDGVTRPVVLDEGTEGPEVRGVDAGGPLHFHCDLAVPKHEVDLEAALRSPEMDLVAEIPVGPVRQDLHEDEVLERPAEELASLLRDTPPRPGARDPHVKQVEFRSLSDDLPLLAPLPGLDEGAEERVDEDLVVLL